jgi:hypothetical protein
VLDAGLISKAQHVEHYEMAGYGTVRTYAIMLGETEQAELLQETLDEEGDADKLLTQLAESSVNIEAALGDESEQETSVGSRGDREVTRAVARESRSSTGRATSGRSTGGKAAGSRKNTSRSSGARSASNGRSRSSSRESSAR